MLSPEGGMGGEMGPPQLKAMESSAIHSGCPQRVVVIAALARPRLSAGRLHNPVIEPAYFLLCFF